MKAKTKIIALLIITILFSSCSEKAVQASTLPKQKITVSWWGTDARNKATYTALDEYKKVNPGVEFDYVAVDYTSYLENIILRFKTNEAPDIISLDSPWVATNAAGNEHFEDLLKYVDIIDMTGFDRYLLGDYCEANGRLIMVPLGINANSVLIDKRLENDYGININAKLTWEKILDDGNKINTINKNHYYINTNLDNLYQCIFKPYLSQLCGSTLMYDENTPNFTDKQFENALEYISKLYKYNVIEPYSEANNYTSIYSNPKWANTEFHASIDWTSAILASGTAELNENYMLTTPPVIENTDNTAIIVRPTVGFAINALSKNIPLCAEIINFFINDKRALNALGTVRSIPANSNAQAILQANKIITPNIIEVMELSNVKKGKAENTQSQIDKIKSISCSAIKEVAGGANPKDTAKKYYNNFSQ